MKENEIIPQQERLTNKPVKQLTSSSSSAYTTDSSLCVESIDNSGFYYYNDYVRRNYADSSNS
jgi:hypothetical protein